MSRSCRLRQRKWVCSRQCVQVLHREVSPHLVWLGLSIGRTKNSLDRPILLRHLMSRQEAIYKIWVERTTSVHKMNWPGKKLMFNVLLMRTLMLNLTFLSSESLLLRNQTLTAMSHWKDKGQRWNVESMSVAKTDRRKLMTEVKLKEWKENRCTLEPKQQRGRSCLAASPPAQRSVGTDKRDCEFMKKKRVKQRGTQIWGHNWFGW